ATFCRIRSSLKEAGRTSIWSLTLSTPSRCFTLLLNVVVLLLAILGALVLHGGTLNYFTRAHADRTALLMPNFKQALKHCLAIAIWALVFFFLCFQADKLGDYAYTFPGYLRSELPNWLRKHTSANGFTSVYDFV